MRIIILLKQVPDIAKMGVSRSKAEVYETAKRILNPTDRVGLEVALNLRQAGTGELWALTLGEAEAAEVLREAYALGVDRVVHLEDKAFTGGDALANTRVLGEAIKKIGNFNLIVCGSRSDVGNSGQTGPRLAEYLGLPQTTLVISAEPKKNGLQVKQKWNGQIWEKCLPLPGLITIHPEAATPRLPNALMIMKAYKKEIIKWSASDLGLEPTKVGSAGSALKVRMSFLPETG